MNRIPVVLILLLIPGISFGLDFNALETIYYPTPTKDYKTYFLNGKPFATLVNDSSYVMLYLETGTIANNKYAKLWLLYKKLAVEPYLLEPLKQIKLTIDAEDEIFAGLIPMPPSQISKSIDDQKNANMIVQAIGGALQTVASAITPEATVTTPTGTVYKVDDTNVGTKIIEKTGERMQGIAYMYEAFKNSVNNGILRRNTLFQDKGVTGNIYFHVGGIDLRKCTKITLYLTIKEGIKVIEFIPREGE